MQKAFVKKNPPWVNYPDISTPIIADELNRVETGIDTIDDRVVAMDSSKANQNDLNVTFKNVSFDSTTGTFTFTKWNDTTVVVDTDIEKIAVDMDYDDDPTSAHYQQIVLTLSDGTVKYIDVSALITQYEFEDTATIAFSVSNSGVISANIVDGSITGAKLQPNYLADITTQANSAYESSTASGNYKLDSEAWANGTRNGQDVPSTDPAYHNNAKYWKDQAQHIAAGDLAGLTDVDLNNPTDGQVLTYNASTQYWINADSAKGMVPHIIINSEASATVTLSKGGTTITATETSSGVYECDVEEYGTYTITLSSGGQSATKTLDIDTVKVYETSIYTFAATITVTYPSGGTCSCSKSGETTLYANTNPYTFTVYTSGTWTITVTANGETYTESVNVTTSGQTASLTMPVGSTVTPTDSVATLLSCAGVNDSNITTLSDLLADSTTLLAVISSNNAIDYLVRSTSFAKQEALIPTMTSNTQPSGECFGSSVESGRDYYYAFDGNSSTEWTSGNYNTDNHLGYGFTSSKHIKCCKFTVRQTFGTGGVIAGVLEKSSDKSNWTSIGSFETENLPNLTTEDITILCDDTDTNFRIRRTTGTDRFALRNVQLYSNEQGFCDNSTAMTYIGANNYASNTLLADSTWLNAIANSTYVESVLNVKVPTMTSNTTPSGVCSASASYTGRDPYHAFDGDSSSEWTSGDYNVNNWLAYMFSASKKCNACKFTVRQTAGVTATISGNIEASNDGTTWTSIETFVTPSLANNEQYTLAKGILNTTQYQYYRIYRTSGEDRFALRNVQFYGREDV